MRTGSYTYGEEHAIGVLAPLGAEYVALVLDRDVECVRRKASRLGVSLKKSLHIHVRDMSEQQRAVVVRMNPTLLCPACGKRFINTPSGCCDVCHLRALEANHNAEHRRLSLEAKRDYNVAKQQVKRLRERLGVTAPKAPRARGGDGRA